MGTAFIENENKKERKQDYELNAAKRLLGKNQKIISKASNLHQKRYIVCNSTIHEVLQGGILLGISVHVKNTRQKILDENLEWIKVNIVFILTFIHIYLYFSFFQTPFKLVQWLFLILMDSSSLSLRSTALNIYSNTCISHL